MKQPELEETPVPSFYTPELFLFAHDGGGREEFPQLCKLRSLSYANEKCSGVENDVPCVKREITLSPKE